MQQEKPALRNEAKRKRAALAMPALSERIAERVQRLPEFIAARHVLLYLAMPGEITVEGLAGSDKRWYAPRCAPKRRLAVHPYLPGKTPLRAGPFGIREPDAEVVPEADPAVLDLVLVPALLLTTNGDRLGYGGGYYDRFLPHLAPHCVTVGAVPEALIIPALPSDAWDIPLRIVVTEENLYRRSV